MRIPLFMILLTTATAGWAGPLEEAQAAWARRAEPGQTVQAIALWQKAFAESPQRTELLLALAKASGKAFRNSETRAEKRKWADTALRYANEAVEKRPTDSWAHAYLGEALGQWAQANKGLKGLRMVKQAVAELQKAIQLDPKNHYAHMLLSEFYRQAPAGISIGDKAKALVEARKAVAEGPNYAINHLALARALLAGNDKAEAIQTLRKLVNLPPPPDAIPETRSDQETARHLLESLGAATPIVPAALPGTCVESAEQSCTPR
jgi:tetratricopeptide (TPR) repeat protein